MTSDEGGGYSFNTDDHFFAVGDDCFVEADKEIGSEFYQGRNPPPLTSEETFEVDNGLNGGKDISLVCTTCIG